MTKAIDNQDVCATVRIRTKPSAGNPEGITEINKSDYDPARHQLAEGDQASLNLTDTGNGGPVQPKGSAVLVGSVKVGNNENDVMEAGMIAGMAHSASGLDIPAWNALADADREQRIADALKTIRDKNGYKPAGPFG